MTGPRWSAPIGRTLWLPLTTRRGLPAARRRSWFVARAEHAGGAARLRSRRIPRDSSDRISAFRGARARAAVVTRLAETFATALSACNEHEQHHRQALVIRGEHQQREVDLRDAERFPPLGVRSSGRWVSWRETRRPRGATKAIKRQDHHRIGRCALADATGRGGSSASEPRQANAGRQRSSSETRAAGAAKRTSSSINARRAAFHHTAAVGLPDVADLREGDRAARRRRSTGPRAPPATAGSGAGLFMHGPHKAQTVCLEACQERAARASGVILRLAGVRIRCIVR